MANKEQFYVVWGELSAPVQSLFVTLAHYPTNNNLSYVVGAVWALEYTKYLDSEQAKYLLALAGQIRDDNEFKLTLKGWLQ